MSSHNDPLQPTPFDAVQPAPEPNSAKRNADGAVPRSAPAWVLPALGGLVLLAVLVIFWLPNSLESVKSVPAPTTAETAGTAASGQPATVAGKPSPTGADASPWSDAQAARLRKEAQEMLAQLLELQDTLQTHGVEQWARDAFADVATLAVDGDALYKTRQYAQATASYQQALMALQALQDAMPEELNKRLEAAAQAMEDGDKEAVLAELTIAALIEPSSSDIASLQQRAELLPQVLPLLEQAAAAETDGDLSQAQQLLQQAATLDPLHQRARSELQRITEKARSQDFNKAMSEGYSALNEGRFDTAKKAFLTAAALQQGSTEAASALQQVATAQTAQRLGTLNQRGQKNEQQEQWQKAVDDYEQAQKLDSSIVFASEGLQRSRERATLDQKLRNTIKAPQRLSDAAVAIDTAKQLQQAKQYRPRGPVLARQIDRLETLLQQANTTVTITLRSDKETEVFVNNVDSEASRFAERELSLRPGTYIVTGTRDGYHDVRPSFTIGHDSDPTSVTIICTDPI
jgi:tetratricopeptide (TPR) repeat protein